MLFAIEGSIAVATFKDANTPYAEVYLQIDGFSLKYKTVDSVNYQANIEVLILIKQDSNIVQYDKFILNTPPNPLATDFFDLKRFKLSNGKYMAEVTITDLNRKDATQKLKKMNYPFEVSFVANNLQLSDIQLCYSWVRDTTERPLTKVGFSLEINPSAYFRTFQHFLGFYQEIYDADKKLTEDFIFSYGIEFASSGAEVMRVSKRKSPKDILVNLYSLNIQSLPSGNYRLFTEVKNKSNELITRKILFFQRNRAYQPSVDSTANDAENTFLAKLTPDQIRYALKALAPKMSTPDIPILNQVIASNNPKTQLNFLHRYWINQSPENTEAAYLKFMELADFVNQRFKSGFGYGFETDRGNICMKYGKPNDIVAVDDDPVAPPYEIWVYYAFPVTNQSNVKFLFYNPSLAGGDYLLLHSNARGEKQNPRWQLELYKRAPLEVDGDNYHDATSMQENFNRRAGKLLEDF